ncbi:uncharacterized protein RJT21DRAFT_2596 [Scheffersomyces amazonensis]|uniref:uncharacterized protein n=1 Tax=Scheffersomyces amazonensis TaxID=1078765 RepID=UPI00315C4E37
MSGKNIFLQSPTVHPEFAQRIQSLPDFRSKLLASYKQLYRLRNLIDRGMDRNKYGYIQLIRRNFERISFQNRRNIVLSHINGGSLPVELTEEEIIQRLINTIAFVFNSTVKKETEFTEKDIQYFKDLKKVFPESMELQIVRTIIRMDKQKPDRIKYDFKYNWLSNYNDSMIEARKYYDKYPTARKLPDDLNFDLSYIGFRNHELLVMGLNESMKLCL